MKISQGQELEEEFLAEFSIKQLNSESSYAFFKTLANRSF